MTVKVSGTGAVMAYLHQMGNDRLRAAIQAGDLSQFLDIQSLQSAWPAVGARSHGEEKGSDQVTTTESITALVRQARAAMPNNRRIAGHGTDQERYQTIPGMSRTAGVSGSLSLRQLVPQLPGSASQTYNIPAGSKVALSTVLAKRSRVAQAGAHIIPVTMPKAPRNAPAGSFYDRAGAFTLLESAEFQAAGEEAPAAAQALPFKSQDVDVSLMKSYAVRFALSRREQRDNGDAELSARIMTGITLGLANLIDRELLAYIADSLLDGSAMPPFTLAGAASAGLRFDELSALVGTEAAGAAVAQDGALRVDGVPSQLTAEIPHTLVGAFDRSAVAIMDDIPLLVQRPDAKGSLVITAWVDLMPLVPDAGYFWGVA